MSTAEHEPADAGSCPSGKNIEPAIRARTAKNLPRPGTRLRFTSCFPSLLELYCSGASWQVSARLWTFAAENVSQQEGVGVAVIHRGVVQVIPQVVPV